jgi:hypothetical protein
MQLALSVPLIYRPGQTAAPCLGGCWTCSHFHGEVVARGAHVVCRRAGLRQVTANPAAGCAFHQREPGVD